jgi:hypothetical protein
VADVWPRAGLAVLLVLALGLALTQLKQIPRDLALAIFAVATAVLGIFALFGPTAAVIGGVAIVGAFAVGAVLYGLIALLGRLVR